MNLQALMDAIEPMYNNTLHNYIVPGLTSHLIGGPKHGLVRLFESERATMEFITPHSHRFDFTCLVLRGDVANTIFQIGGPYDELWCHSEINQVCGKDGLNDYVHTREEEPTQWHSRTDRYTTGDTYGMKYGEIHSIKFTRGTKVLFFEGPQQTVTSRMIEPWENGAVVPTFRTEPWMFQKV